MVDPYFLADAEEYERQARHSPGMESAVGALVYRACKKSVVAPFRFAISARTHQKMHICAPT